MVTPQDPKNKRKAESPPIVGIGASAGGMAALKSLFSRIPENSGLAYVVVVHLSPEHKSVLAELLQPYVKMPVIQVSRTLALEPNHVYVIPPNANLNTIDTHLRLTKLEEERGLRAPIDHFFRTLSKTHKGKAAGIILTGTGSDGTLGIKEIKEKGGLTIVQDPREAEFDGMPQSAISTGLADVVLPVKEIPDAFIRYFRTHPAIKSLESEKARDEEESLILQRIFAQVKTRSRRDFSGYKLSTLLRRIQRRMQIHHITLLDDYLEFLRNNEKEVLRLSDDFLINVTNFFRDREVFDYMEKEIIPGIISHKKPGEQVRIWSVGCATGEEAYSIGMLANEAVYRIETPISIQIFATDLHEPSLKRAREGFFPGDIHADVGSDRLKKFFIKEDGGYRIRKEIREQVIFTSHNLLGDPPFSKVDLILCRNLMIYLKREVQQDVYELFHYALLPWGYLLLGSSENLEERDLFLSKSKKHSVYVKKNVTGPEISLPVFPGIGSRPGEGYMDRQGNPPVAPATLHQRVLAQYGPPSVILNSDHQVMHVSQKAGRYMKIPGGELSRDIFKLIRPELQMELRSSLFRSVENKQHTHSKPVPVSIEGEERQVLLSTMVVQDVDHEEVILLLFEESDGLPKEKKEKIAVKGEGDRQTIERYAGRVSELEEELQETRQRLQAIIEEYETSREEMKASNEELQSANEELRSTMEELETSKEELQSMNEELSTLNQENRHKVEELSNLSSDLQNLLAATDIATLFLDRDLLILRFTPRVGQLFNVRPADKGRPISDQTSKLGYPGLPDDARKVLRDLQPLEREVGDLDGRFYIARILPYRSTDDRIEGVVISFIDITRRRQMEESLRESDRQFRALVNATSYVTFRLNPDWSEMRELDGKGSISDTLAPIPDWMDKYILKEDQPRLKQAIDEAIRSKSTFALQHRLRRSDGSVCWTYSRAIPVLNEKENIIEWFGAASDISQQVNTEQALHASEARRLISIEAANVGDWWMKADTNELYWSPKVREMLGVSQDEPADFDLADSRIHPEDRARVRSEIDNALNPGGIGEYDLEFRILHPGGEQIWVRSRARAMELPLEGKSPGRYLYGAMTDITQQKQTLEELYKAKEEAEQAAKAKEDFLAHISHEIRTPLHAIVGLSHLLMQQGPKKEQLENLQTLTISAENLSRLINDVLDFSKIESGKVNLEKEPFRLDEFIGKIFGVHTSVAREKKLELESHIDSSIPEIIVTDQMILSQVLHNLLSNAVKFTPEGKVSLEVRSRGRKGKKHRMEFSVNDTGIGIPANKIDIIFDVFSQADSSTVRQYGGSGLGLAITKRYLEMLGSRIRVESKAGKGSRFFFTLAAETGEEAVKDTDTMPAGEATPSRMKEIRGLLVEDDPYNRLILKQLLSMWDMSFDEAENGLQAVEKAEKKQFQLILLDIHMPVMDGFDAARRIRKLPGYRDTAIIALTADISEKIKKEVRSGLFSEVHIKPFEPEKLNRRITEIARRANKE